MSTDKERSIYIKTEAMTRLKAADAERVEEQMKAKIAEEEQKQIERRAKQEQQLAYRANKKVALQAARLADTGVQRCCEDLKGFLDQRAELKNKITACEEHVHEAAKAVQNFENLLAKARSSLEEAQEKHRQSKQVADNSILELKRQRLREAFNRSNEAWEQVQKATRKKERDRATKKLAKELLGE